jgi:hypothetical protein
MPSDYNLPRTTCGMDVITVLKRIKIKNETYPGLSI